MTDRDIDGVDERHCDDDGVLEVIADVEIVPVVDTEEHTEEDGDRVPDRESVLEMVGDTVLVGVKTTVSETHAVTDAELHLEIVAEPDIELPPDCVNVVEMVKELVGLCDGEPEREKMDAVAQVVSVPDVLALGERERPENVADTLGLALDDVVDDDVTEEVIEWLGEPVGLLGAESVGDNDGDVVIE